MRLTLVVALIAPSLVACTAGPFALLREASGAVSQTLCSKTFVSGLDPATIYREQLRPEPGMFLVAWAMQYDIDRDKREVTTRIAGGYERRSVFREGRGCTLAYEGVLAPSALRRAGPPPEPEQPIDLQPSAAVRAALDAAFSEPADGPVRGTKAIVIAHGGHVIAERYAAGYDRNTLLLSHSVAKSVVNALVGVLVRQGKLSVSRPAPWRADVTIDNLLRMNAGFSFDEGGGNAAPQMWFNRPDTVAYAVAARRNAAPGARWQYSSRSYALLSRIVGDAIGGGPQAFRDFAERELFAPLGMRNVTLEFDSRGTLMGANAMFASARDWARFGELYLHDGRAGARRILPADWVRYSTTPTGDTGYGASFFLNHTQASMPSGNLRWGIPGAPADAFAARGYLGQFIVIVPSADLVVVRFGISHAPGYEVASVGRLVRDVIASLALHTAQSPDAAL